MVAVVFLAHAWLSVAADGEAQVFALWWAGRRRGFGLFEGCHVE